MIRKIKINEELIKIIISALFFTLSFFTTKNSILYFVLLILSYIVISYEIYIDAFKNKNETILLLPELQGGSPPCNSLLGHTI